MGYIVLIIQEPRFSFLKQCLRKMLISIVMLVEGGGVILV